MRLVEGRPDHETVYGADPVAVARRWEELGARMLHVVDLDGAMAGELRHLDLVAEILRAVSIPVQVGGGIRDPAAVERLLGLGAARVVLGSVVLRTPGLAREVCARFGDAVVAAIDARGGQVAVQGWRELVQRHPVEVARMVAGWGVRRIIFTDITRDGTLGGPNVEAAAALVRETGLAVIAAGGIASLEDLRRLKGAGVEGVIVGKALYEGTFSLSEAMAVAEGERPC